MGFLCSGFSVNVFAMATPSLHTMGEPHCFWINTDLDFGPNVMRTASASCVAPRRIFSRATDRNNNCLYAMFDPQLRIGRQRRS